MVVEFLLDDLVRWHPVLSRALHPTTSTGAAGGTKPGSKPPLRVDILDLMRGLQIEALVWEQIARQILGFGPAPSRNVVRALRWVRDAVVALDQKSPVVMQHLSHEINSYHYRVSIAVGVVAKPLRLQLGCPYCGQRLTVQIDKAIIWCKNEQCRCAVETCLCHNRMGHHWPQDDWALLERMTRDTPEQDPMLGQDGGVC